MEDFKSHQILAKTQLHSTITGLISFIIQCSVIKYKPLLLQITNINSKLKTITLSDSIDSFIFHISLETLEDFKNTINKYIMLTKLIGTCVMITKWNIIYSLLEKTHKLDIQLIIEELKYMDALGNEYIEGVVAKNSFYKQSLEFAIDLQQYQNLKVTDPLRQNLLKLKKMLIKQEYRKRFNEIGEIGQDHWRDIFKEYKKIDMFLPIKDIKEKAERLDLKELTKTNEKINTFNEKKTKKNDKNIDKEVKLIYDQKILKRIYGENDQNSVISDLESLNLHDSETEKNENMENIPFFENFIHNENNDIKKNSENKEKNEENNEKLVNVKKRKLTLEEENVEKNPIKKVKLDENMHFSMAQILKYKKLIQMK